MKAILGDVRYLAEEMQGPSSDRGELAEAPVAPVAQGAPMAIVLAALVLVAYAGVARNGFIGLDDNDYVTQNPRVQQGLTWSGVAWAFTTVRSANWHPLTWLSHMLDCQLAGTSPALPHLVNLALHLASTLLLFRLFLRITSADGRMTGAIGPSTFVAAVFGLHPLHVESVAWVAERKDVLSAFFAILTLSAYAGWVARPTASRRAAVFLLYALGLLAKPMLVTLPFVLLLMDRWPLRREKSLASLAVEKLDLFALAAASSVTTFLVQRAAGAMTLSERVPFGLRVENALVAYTSYLGKSLVPVDLAVYYPHPAAPYGAGRVALAAAIVAGLTLLAWRASRSRPWITVGWLWFAGMLVPVIGLVQVGSQAMADRYAYLPMIGLSIAVGYEGAALARRGPAARLATTALAVVAVGAWTWLARAQVATWKDDRTLFTHAAAVVPESHLAHGILGNVHVGERRYDLAIREYEEALRLRPDYAQGHSNLGMAYELSGRPADAIEQYREALRSSPGLAEAHHNLGRLLATRGELGPAIAELEAAIRSNPELVEAHVNLGVALLAAGRKTEAIAEFRKALELRPGDAEARRRIEKAEGSQ